MRVKKFLLQTVIILACLFLVVPGVSFAKTKLKLGHTGALNHHYHEGSLLFQKLVAEKSNGDTEIVVFPANQL